MHTGKPVAAFNNGGVRTDFDQMTDTPTRIPHHRRAQSETFFRFPDDEDMFLNDVVADFNFNNIIDLPSLSSDAVIPTTTCTDSSSKSEPESSDVKNNNSNNNNDNISMHGRSLSVDEGFFNGLGLGGGEGYNGHRRSGSMDGESVLMVVDNSKKALAPDKLAELALIDPKRAKRSGNR